MIAKQVEEKGHESTRNVQARLVADQLAILSLDELRDVVDEIERIDTSNS